MISRRWVTLDRRWRAIAAAFKCQVLLMCGACASESGEAPPTCVAPLDEACTPAYEPTYDAIYSNLLSKTCGAASTGGVCHYAAGAHSDLSFSDIEQSYGHLLGQSGAQARVVPGTPECSPLVQRLESDDPTFRMPVGRDQLSLGERCAVRQWIAEGAKR